MPEPSDLRCAFDGHIHRADICQGRATSFLRTPRGVIWPFCTPCADRQKKLVSEMVGTRIAAHHVIATTFDIPITDETAQEQFRTQNPEKIRAVLARADALHAELLDEE
jgi:hypothetical protein